MTYNVFSKILFIRNEYNNNNIMVTIVQYVNMSLELAIHKDNVQRSRLDKLDVYTHLCAIHTTK